MFQITLRSGVRQSDCRFFLFGLENLPIPFASMTYEHFLDWRSGLGRELVVRLFESKPCTHFYIHLKRNDL
jgi:hypothetical protein